MTTVVKKIDDLPAMTDTVANNDELVMLDVSASAVDMTKLITMSQIPISLASQLSQDVVENAAIKGGAVTTAKILDGNVTYAKIQKSQNAFVLGNKASTTGTADAIVEIQPSAASQVLLGSTGTTNTVDFGKVTSAHIAAMTSAQLAGVISDETGTGKLVFATSPTLVTPALGTPASGTLTNCTGLKHVVYMQLFLPDEAIISTTARTQFFVPSYLAGGKVKQLGIGVVSSSTGKTVAVALGSSYGSVSGVTSAETADTLNYTLPAAMTKIPINVTCTTGDPAPKGLDFWFVVLK